MFLADNIVLSIIKHYCIKHKAYIRNFNISRLAVTIYTKPFKIKIKRSADRTSLVV
jgi:hypothetical protein